MSSIRRAALRTATAQIHEQVDELMQRTGAFARLDAYGAHLQHMHLFHRRFGAQIAERAPAWDAQWGIGDRIGWLAADLQALSLPALPLDAAADLPLPALATRAEILGGLYVLMGSSLGASVLVRRLPDMGVAPERGGGYLTHLAGLRQWPAFLSFLESEPVEDERLVAAGATETFDSLYQHLTQPA